MAKKAFNKILAGIEDMKAYLDGDTKRGRTHQVRVIVPDEVDVKAVRDMVGLSQAGFAARFGLELRAIQEWEQGRRKPDRSSRILLKVIEKNPDAVEKALA